MAAQKVLKKIFGIGPVGAAASLCLLAFFLWADATFTLTIAIDHAGVLKTFGVLLMALGFGLHCWSFSTLRSWWIDDQLCTKGPFRYVRHPMYAAWITFICPGAALYLNSWWCLFWVLLVHVLWHQLVKEEEKIMLATFGDAYRAYAARTGRFFPVKLG